MNAYVKEQPRYAEIRKAADGVFNISKVFPENILRQRRQSYICTEESDWQRKGFWPFLSVLAESIGDSWWSVLLIDPEMADYYETRFGCYPAILGSNLGDELEYLSSTILPPGHNSAEAIGHLWNAVVLIGSSEKWAAYFDRRMELGLFAHADALSTFIRHEYPFQFRDSFDEALDFLGGQRDLNSYRDLVENYKFG